MVLPAPPGKSVSPLNTTGWPSMRKQVDPGVWPGRVDRAQPEAPDLDHVVVGDREVVGGEHRGVVGGDPDVDAGVADRLHRLDVVPVAVGREHPADARGPAHLEEQLVLVRGVDEDGVAARLVADDEHVVLERADDDLVDPDVGGLVVRRARCHRSSG